MHPTFGDPDVYIKNGVTEGEVASKTNFDFSSIKDQYHDDQVTIRENQICTECTISIAVVGFTKSHYSLTAVTSDVTITLSDGKPFKESVSNGKTQDFMYKNAEDGDVMIIMTMLSGLAYMTAAENRTFANPEHCLLGSPCKKDYSAEQADIPMILMSGRQAGDFTYIGITGEDESANGVDGGARFTLMTRNIGGSGNGHVISLLAGVPQNYVSLSQTDVAYFQVRLGSGHDDVRVFLQPRSGSFIMYAKKCSGTGCEVRLGVVENVGMVVVVVQHSGLCANVYFRVLSNFSPPSCTDFPSWSR